jgi:hypothetical protein
VQQLSTESSSYLPPREPKILLMQPHQYHYKINEGISKEPYDLLRLSTYSTLEEMYKHLLIPEVESEVGTAAVWWVVTAAVQAVADCLGTAVCSSPEEQDSDLLEQSVVPLHHTELGPHHLQCLQSTLSQEFYFMCHFYLHC